MLALSNPRHERFAQEVASGKPTMEAYKLASYKESSAKPNAVRMMENDGICKRIAELRVEQAAKCEMRRDELRRFLVEVVTTPAGQIDKHSRLCQSYKDTADYSEIKMPDKLRAAELLGKMAGWFTPDKLELSVDPLQALIDSIRSRVERPGAANHVRLE